MGVRSIILIFSLYIAASVAASGVELTNSDRLALLYTPQLQFGTDGAPLIKIGIIEGQDAVSFRPTAPITVLPLGIGGPSVELPADQHYRISLSGGTEGRYRYWVVVYRSAFSTGEDITEVQNLWSERGYAPRLFRLGSLFAIHGVTFDNRQTAVAIGGTETQSDMLRLAAELEEEYNILPDLHTELLQYPSGELALTNDTIDVGITHNDLLWVNIEEGGEFILDGDSFSTNPEPGDGSPRHYVGSLIFSVDKEGTLTAINEVSAERLLEGILPAEIYASAPSDALKAQAVAARGELLADLGVRYLAEPYMTCADQRCQVYDGVSSEHPRTSHAVNETRGEVLLINNRISRAVYSASCGGSLGDYDSTWGGAPRPHLVSHIDSIEPVSPSQDLQNETNVRAFLQSNPPTFDNIESYRGQLLFRWNLTLDEPSLSERVNTRYPLGRVHDLTVLQRDDSGRVTQLLIMGETGQAVIERELPIRRALGGLRSALFVMDIDYCEEGFLREVNIQGGGFGHGVGLCQIGSIGAAERGLGYHEILSHYYTGTQINQLW